MQGHTLSYCLPFLLLLVRQRSPLLLLWRLPPWPLSSPPLALLPPFLLQAEPLRLQHSLQHGDPRLLVQHGIILTAVHMLAAPWAARGPLAAAAAQQAQGLVQELPKQRAGLQ